MAALKAKTAKLGPPKIEGTDPVAGKDVPALYFGTTKMNNNFDIVDEVVKDHGGTATLFVESGDEYVRVATNVKKDDGSRAIGTVLDPHGPVHPMMQKGEAYYGDANILGKEYVTGYDPARSGLMRLNARRRVASRSHRRAPACQSAHPARPPRG